MRNPSHSPSAISVLRDGQRTGKSVLIPNYMVINMESVLETKNGSTQFFSQETPVTEYMSTVYLRQTKSDKSATNKSFIQEGSVKTETKLSEILKHTAVESTLSGEENIYQTTDQHNTEVSISSRTSVSTANAVSVATREPLLSKPNRLSGVAESKVLTSHKPIDVVHYPMQDQMNLQTDNYEGFT